jgi:hypothetical protein
MGELPLFCRIFHFTHNLDSVLIIFFGAAPDFIGRILQLIQTDFPLNCLRQINIQLVCQANQIDKNICKLSQSLL